MTEQQVIQQREKLRESVELELTEMQNCIHAISSNLLQGAKGGHLSINYVGEKTDRIIRSANRVERWVKDQADDR